MTKNWISSVATTKNIVITLILLLGSIIFFAYSDIDVSIANLFYDFEAHQWIYSDKTQPYRFIFYDGIKKLLIIVGVLFLIALLLSKKVKALQSYKKGLMLVVLSAIIIPLFISGLKAVTNMPCPEDEIAYGGKYPKTKVWECYDAKYAKLERIKCWPAGHASGGFALMSLYFLFKKRKNKLLGLAMGLSVGWAMGLYKMAVGDHFFSHTVITMLITWLIILILAKILKVEEREI